MRRHRDVVVRQLTGWHMPLIAWHRLSGRRVGLMDESIASSWIRDVAHVFGATAVDLGRHVLDAPMSSPWTELDSLIPSVMGSVPFHAGDSPECSEEDDLWRMSLRREVAKYGLDQLIAVRWARAGHEVVYYGTSTLDPRIGRALSGRIAAVHVWPNLIDSALSRITHKVAAKSRRSLASAASGYSRASSVGAEPDSPADVRGRVLFILNRGLNYGDLYRYDQYFSDDAASAFHEENMSYLASKPRTLENGQHALGLTQLSSKIPLWRLILAEIQSLSGIRGDRDLTRHREGFYSRATSYTEGIAREFPRVELAIFAFDIQVPIEISVALRRRGIRSIASHERPQAGLVPYLTLVADRLLTASPEFSRLLENSPHALVRECLPCGFWRTDHLVEMLAGGRDRVVQRPTVLVLPYELLGEDVVARMPSELTVAGFAHFLEDVCALVEEFPQADFIVRAKTDAWATDPRVDTVVDVLTSMPNVFVSHDYRTPLESYRLAGISTMVIGKYTSLVEEALACRIPAIIHDYTHNAHEGMCEMSPYLPAELFIHSRQELLTRAREVLADDGATFRAAWEPRREKLYGSLSDGRVRDRSMQSATALLAAFD